MLAVNDHDDGSNNDRDHEGDGYRKDSDEEDEDGDAERRRPGPYSSTHTPCTGAPLLGLKKNKQGTKPPLILSQRQDRTENQRGTFQAHACTHMQRRTSPPVSQSSQANASRHDASMNQSL